MKNLKFRIYDKTEKRMKYLDSIWNMPDPSYDFDEIQQFTGLLDKSGKEIYEGDILGYKKEKMKVFMDSHKGQWGVRFPNKWKTTPKATEFFKSLLWASKKGEIIGNIYQNPELLSSN